jgi:hypothetical protein
MRRDRDRPPEPDGGPTRVRLRRPVRARLFSGPLQTLLTLNAIVTVGLLGLAIAGKIDFNDWAQYLFEALLVALWLPGVTAWAEVDDAGLRWRYWMKCDLAWRDVARVALGQRAIAQYGPGPDLSQPAIIVRSKGDDEFVRPAAACGRGRKEFGTAVLRFAAAHHRHTEVIGKHWAEPATTQEMPWA